MKRFCNETKEIRIFGLFSLCLALCLGLTMLGTAPALASAPVYSASDLFTSRDLEVLSADIPAETVSDHRPYLVQLRLPENDGRPAPRPQA